MRWLVSRGWHGWVILLAFIVAFDVGAALWGGESMTYAARRWFAHGIGRWFVLVAIVYLAIHLTVLPERMDPLDRSNQWLQRKYGNNPTYVNPPIEHAPGGKG